MFIGGSATNQGGIGMAKALGYGFVDREGKQLAPVGENLRKIYKIIKPQKKIFDGVQFCVSTDVSNALLGPYGATYIYGPQKGATRQQLPVLQKGMTNLSNNFIEYLDKNVTETKGGGAAGGLGAGSVAFLDAQIRNGFDTLS